jgi:hypothetical protein
MRPTPAPASTTRDDDDEEKLLLLQLQLLLLGNGIPLTLATPYYLRGTNGDKRSDHRQINALQTNLVENRHNVTKVSCCITHRTSSRTRPRPLSISSVAVPKRTDHIGRLLLVVVVVVVTAVIADRHDNGIRVGLFALFRHDNRQSGLL